MKSNHFLSGSNLNQFDENILVMKKRNITRSLLYGKIIIFSVKSKFLLNIEVLYNTDQSLFHEFFSFFLRDRVLLHILLFHRKIIRETNACRRMRKVDFMKFLSRNLESKIHHIIIKCFHEIFFSKRE